MTENFADGAYSTYEAGDLIAQKSVNADKSYDIAHFDVSGLGYSSYEDIFNATGTKVAEAQDLTSGAGNLLLYANGLTVSSSSGPLSVKSGADTFTMINSHADETITVSGKTGETFDYSANFGQSAISGFLATGPSHDVIQLETSMFNLLNATMTPTQELAALLTNYATQNGANVVIVDFLGDKLTLNAVTTTTLAANPNDFKFV